MQARLLLLYLVLVLEVEKLVSRAFNKGSYRRARVDVLGYPPLVHKALLLLTCFTFLIHHGISSEFIIITALVIKHMQLVNAKGFP